MRMDVRFSESKQVFATKVNTIERSFGLDFGQIQTITEIVGGELYGGDYVVTPKVVAQTLPTKRKLLEDDLTVDAIPCFRVSNTSGGSTVYIAKEV